VVALTVYCWSNTYYLLLLALCPQKIAMRVLAQPASAPASERNWSMYNSIHSKARNRLSHARASKLVYCFSNLNLLVEAKSSVYQDIMVAWQGAGAEEEDNDSQPTFEDEEVVDISESKGEELGSDEGEGEGGMGGMGVGCEEEVEVEVEEMGSEEDLEDWQPEVCEQPSLVLQVEGGAASVSQSGRVRMPSRKAMS